MDAARDVLAALERAGVRVDLRADGAVVLSPKDKITPELREATRARKPEIVALLRANGAEVTRSPRLRAMAQSYAELDARHPGRWCEIRREIDRHPDLKIAIADAEQALDEAARQGDDEAFADALVRFECVWVSAAGAVEQSRPGPAMTSERAHARARKRRNP